MGWFNIYAAVYNEEHVAMFDLSQRYGKQFIWIVIAVLTGILVLIIDSRFYFFFAWAIYITIVVMLILLLFFGKEIYGAKSWFEFSWFSLQPSEFAKLGVALALASYLNSRRQDLTKLKTLIPAAGIIMFPAMLTLMQPDLGSTVVFLGLFIPLFREGMSPYVFLSGFLALILFFLTLLVNEFHLSLGVTFVALLITWFVTRKWKPVLSGAGILLLVGGIVFVLNYFLFKYFDNNTVIVLVSVFISGIVFAWYFYIKKALAALTVYLFLIGSLAFVNSVDYAYDNMLQEHQIGRAHV